MTAPRDMEILLELSVFSDHGSTVTQRSECTMPLFSFTEDLKKFEKLRLSFFLICLTFVKIGVSDVKQPAPAYQTSRGAALAKCIIILQTGFCLCVQGTHYLFATFVILLVFALALMERGFTW